MCNHKIFKIALVLGFLFSAQARAETVTLGVAGDLMLGRLYNDHLAQNKDAKPLGNVAPVLASADLTLINQEFALTTSDQKWNGAAKSFYFKADPTFILPIFKEAGINYVSLANNHILDYNDQGLKDTLAILKKNGISYAGAGINSDEATKPVRIQKNGASFLIFSVTDNMKVWEAQKKKAGVFYIPINNDGLKTLLAKIEKEKKENDIVVVSLHWGGNWDTKTPQAFTTFARSLVDNGVSVVHGHSSHVLQGFEVYKGKPIFYNLGDLIDDYALKKEIRNDLSYVALVTLNTQSGDAEKIQIIPTKRVGFQTNLATGGDQARVIKTIKNLSEPMGTTLASSKNGFFATSTKVSSNKGIKGFFKKIFK